MPGWEPFVDQLMRTENSVVQCHDRSRMLIQVFESMADPRTRKRKITALAETMTELKLQEGTPVTRGEEETILLETQKNNRAPPMVFSAEYAGEYVTIKTSVLPSISLTHETTKGRTRYRVERVRKNFYPSDGQSHNKTFVLSLKE